MKQRLFHITIFLSIFLLVHGWASAIPASALSKSSAEFSPVSPEQVPELFNKPQTPSDIEKTVREYFRQDKWAEGKKVLDDTWRDYGTMSSLNELMGRYYFHFKNYDRARFYLVRALRDDNSNTLARELLVSVEEETKNYSSAICYVNELLEANPYSRQLWRRKINIYRKQGNTEEANRLLTRLQQIYPNDNVVKKDVEYINELRLAKQRKANDVVGQIETLNSLISVNPKNSEYYNSLANALLQAGRVDEAIEVLGRGARLTGNTKLMVQRASMLNEQGKYIEALNYLKECYKKHPSADIQSVINQTEVTAAENAQLNDPYTAMAKVYSSQHSKEALNYLLNTSLARGYYEDALMYIKEAKSVYGNKEDILYREFLVHRRLGNKGKAMSILQKLYDNHAKNADVAEYLSEMKYDAAATMMGAGLYADAIEDLEFAEANTYDNDLRKHCIQRLFNCYLETHDYEQASRKIKLLYDKYGYSYTRYAFQKSALLKVMGRVKDALTLLYDADSLEMDSYQAQLLAFQYEEYAMPYIRDMINKGMIHQANKAVKEALKVCPTSNELLHQALTTTDILGNYQEFYDIVYDGRTRYPDDPFFIVKEAGLNAHEGKYAEAIAELRPELDNYLGDSTVVQAFAEYSQKLALDTAKNYRAYDAAMALIDTALVFKHMDHQLLLTKGEIFEMMHEYDSAYVYQQYYKPTLMDYREHSHHLEELMGRQYKNEISIDYTNGRGNDEDKVSGVVHAAYMRHEDYTDYTATIGYTSHNAYDIPDGCSVYDNNGNLVGRDNGSVAIRLGFGVAHSFKDTPWTIGADATWGSKYFPRVTVNAMVKRALGANWTVGIRGGYKNLKALTTCSASLDEISLATNVSCLSYKSLGYGGALASTTVGQFIINGGADVMFANSNVYVSGALHGEYYPITGSKTNIFAEAGAGNAPQQWQMDDCLPCGFGKFNTYVKAGLEWMFNRHISARLSGVWYSNFRGQEMQLGNYLFDTTQPSTNRNIYMINVGANVRF